MASTAVSVASRMTGTANVEGSRFVRIKHRGRIVAAAESNLPGHNTSLIMRMSIVGSAIGAPANGRQSLASRIVHLQPFHSLQTPLVTIPAWLITIGRNTQQV